MRSTPTSNVAAWPATGDALIYAFAPTEKRQWRTMLPMTTRLNFARIGQQRQPNAIPRDHDELVTDCRIVRQAEHAGEQWINRQGGQLPGPTRGHHWRYATAQELRELLSPAYQLALTRLLADQEKIQSHEERQARKELRLANRQRRIDEAIANMVDGELVNVPDKSWLQRAVAAELLYRATNGAIDMRAYINNEPRESGSKDDPTKDND